MGYEERTNGPMVIEKIGEGMNQSRTGQLPRERKELRFPVHIPHVYLDS